MPQGLLIYYLNMKVGAWGGCSEKIEGLGLVAIRIVDAPNENLIYLEGIFINKHHSATYSEWHDESKLCILTALSSSQTL